MSSDYYKSLIPNHIQNLAVESYTVNAAFKICLENYDKNIYLITSAFLGNNNSNDKELSQSVFTKYKNFELFKIYAIKTPNRLSSMFISWNFHNSFAFYH